MGAILQSQTARSSRTGSNLEGQQDMLLQRRSLECPERGLVPGAEEEGDQLEAEATVLTDKHWGPSYQTQRRLMPQGAQS